MKIRNALPVPIAVHRTLVTVALPVLLLLPGGCAFKRDMGKQVEIASGRHEAGTALDSDYLVRKGATLHAHFANGCRIYVESGGAFRGLERGAREVTVYAEKGAKAERREGVHYVRVADASKAYARRGEPVLIEKSPAAAVGEVVAGSTLTRDDDDDDYEDNRRRSRAGKLRISKSSYKKKD